MKMIRKQAAMVLGVLCLGGMQTAAVSAQENSHEDWNQNYITYSYNLFVTEAENGYYFMAENYLYYMDFDMETPVLLCSKVNCTHDGEECNAYLYQESISQIIYYEGAVYAFETITGLTEELVKISADGETREVLLEVDNRDVNNVLIHRGKMYYIQNVGDASAIASYDLDSGEQEIVYQGENDEVFLTLFAWDHYLYFLDTGVDETEEFYMTTKRFDLTKTEEAEEIAVTIRDKNGTYKDTSPMAVRASDGKIYFVGGSEEEQYYLLADPEGGEAIESVELLSGSGLAFWSDDEYIYTISEGSGLKSDKYLYIHTLEGECVETLKIEPAEETYVLSVKMAVGSEATAFFRITTVSDTKDRSVTGIWKLDKSLIGTDDFHLELLIDTE